MNRHFVIPEFPLPRRRLSTSISHILALLLLVLNTGWANGQDADQGRFRLEGAVSVAPCVNLPEERFSPDSDPSHDGHKFQHGLVWNAKRVNPPTSLPN